MTKYSAASAVASTLSNSRIAIVAPSLDILGGQGVQARSLMQALIEDGESVLFIPVNPRFPLGLGWLRRVPVLRTVLNQCLYIAQLSRLRRVGVVHIFSASYWSFLLAPVPAIVVGRLLKKRLILNYHSGEADDHLANWGRAVHPWLRMVDEIVVPSRYLQAVFADYGYRSRVVGNIVDTGSFHYRQRASLAPRLLSNRNLEPHYRVIDVLRAFAILKSHRPDAQLWVAGYGSEEKRLRQWVKNQRLSGVEFLGRVEPESMPGLFEQADIFVNASVIDNQPISILEAFASGLAVISTPTGDIPNMLQQGGCGVLVESRNPAAMVEAIEQLLADPELAQQLCQRARECLVDYQWQSIGPAWKSVYASHKLLSAAGHYLSDKPS